MMAVKVCKEFAEEWWETLKNLASFIIGIICVVQIEFFYIRKPM